MISVLYLALKIASCTGCVVYNSTFDTAEKE